LTRRRIAEAKAAAAVIGIESQVLPIPNGGIEPTLTYRSMFIRLIREFRPDLVVTHRPNDYHPDHRYTSQLVQDSSYLITVPNSAPEVGHLDYQPVMVYMSDTFKKPYPFTPDVVVEIDGEIEKKIDMLHAHASQMYEWIPYNQGRLDEVPADEAERKRWLKQWLKQTMVGKRSTDMAHLYRERLIERYGEQKAAAVEYAEAYEECEYGAALDDEQIARFFGGM
jgi:LmbE family N-acetylglucosaminyl deacetylase